MSSSIRSVQLRAKAELERRKRAATAASEPPLSFRDFIARVNPRYRFYRHCDELIAVLQQVADGEISRLMVFMPPRHSKSETVSRLFAAYYVYRYPERFVGITGYGADLAYTLSRAAREHYTRAGGMLNRAAAAVKYWLTRIGGGLWAAGVGGPATGKGFHLGIVDDPLKDAEQAASDTIRAKQKDWYNSTFSTRQEPGAAIIIVQTRWHEDDLSGWLLGLEDDEPESWYIVNMPAVADDEPPTFPATCTVHPDWRVSGEALCPERYTVEKLTKIAKRIGSYFWNALFQQRPQPAGGGVLNGKWWKFYKVAPAQFDELIQSWDMTFKDTAGSDYVVGQIWGRRGAEYYLLDQVRARMDLPATIQAITALSLKWPRALTKLVEDKANGPAVIATLRNQLPGLIAVDPQGGKVVRAAAVSPAIEAGNVYLPDPTIAPWIGDFLVECTAFPNGKHDDQVDTMTQALNRLINSSTVRIR